MNFYHALSVVVKRNTAIQRLEDFGLDMLDVKKDVLDLW